jgi:GNAT superfamily N-acetyltransferase
MVFADFNLSQRIERTDARITAAFADARAKISPEYGAEWIEVAGAYAIFDGVESPCTQTFGLGMFGEVTNEDLDKIEAFFKERNSPISHEVSPLADASVLALLNERGYTPIEYTNVMFQTLGESERNLALNPKIKTKIIGEDKVLLWAETSANGWISEMPDHGDFMKEFGRISASCDGCYSFLAEIDEKPIATGALFIFGGVAEAAGASTIPEGRKQGAQTALLDARLRFAKEKGCDIVVMGASPGSQSQKNAEKNGFRIAYTRTKWVLGRV